MVMMKRRSRRRREREDGLIRGTHTLSSHHLPARAAQSRSVCSRMKMTSCVWLLLLNAAAVTGEEKNYIFMLICLCFHLWINVCCTLLYIFQHVSHSLIFVRFQQVVYQNVPSGQSGFGFSAM